MGLTGGCLCGALRYEITGEVKYAGLCHCADCQKSTGSAFAPYMGISSADFRYTGAFAIFEMDLGDGRTSRRNFCPKCGSTIFGGDPDHGGMTVYAGTLDDPAQFAPRNEIFIRDRRDWAHVPPGSIPEFEKLP